MSTSQRTWRVLAGTASLGIVYWMAGVVDSGHSRDWPVVSRYVWLIGMLAFLFFGVGSLAQVVGPLLGQSDVRWFPPLPARARILKPLGVGSAILAGVWAISAILPEFTGRAALAGMGLFVIYVALSRTPGFWDAPGSGGGIISIVGLRQLLGDRAVQMIYVFIGLALVAVALFARL
jgi:hypothetical protein